MNPIEVHEWLWTCSVCRNTARTSSDALPEGWRGMGDEVHCAQHVDPWSVREFPTGLGVTLRVDRHYVRLSTSCVAAKAKNLDAVTDLRELAASANTIADLIEKHGFPKKEP